MRRLLQLTVFLSFVVTLARAATLQAGVAQAVITPQLSPQHPVYLAGFGHNRVASGVHDDLTARCLALSAGQTQPLVLCSVDLIGMFYEDVLTIRGQLSRLTHSDAFLIVAATHTHAGPDTLGLYGPKPLASGLDPQYLSWVDARIAATAAEALRNLQPARLILGRDDHPMLGLLQGVDRPPIVKDPYLFAMRLVASATGRTLATLVNWSDHPETLARANTQITADYPHWVRESLEKRYGGTALFFSGALGKVSPLGQVALVDPETGQIAADGTWRKAELLGTEIGRLAQRALDSGDEIPVDSIVIGYQTVFLPMQNPLFRAAEAAGVFVGRKPLYTNGKPDSATEMRDLPALGRVSSATGRDVRTEVDVIQLNSPAVAAQIVTVPGEIYPELVNGGVAHLPGADFPDAAILPPLRSRLPARYQFVFGLANDELGYLIPKAEWDQQPPWLKDSPAPYYGEVNSAAPDAADRVMQAIFALLDR